MTSLELSFLLRPIQDTPTFRVFCSQTTEYVRNPQLLHGEDLRRDFAGRLWELVANDFIVRGGYVNGGTLLQTDDEVVAFYQRFLPRLYGHGKKIISFPFEEVTIENLTTPDAMIIGRNDRIIMLLEHTTSANRSYYDVKKHAYRSQLKDYGGFPEFGLAEVKYVVPSNSPAARFVPEKDLIRVGIRQNEFNEAAYRLLGSLSLLARSFMGL